MAGTLSKDAILLCTEPTGSHWQLGPLPPRAGELLLIGWTLEASDGGVPSKVVEVLARALVGPWRATFPSSAVPKTAADSWQRQGPDYIVNLPHRAMRRAGPHGLLSTVGGSAFPGLFEDGAYPWELQGQFVLLSRPAEEPPDFLPSASLLETLIEPEWAASLPALERLGVEAILRPAVDGAAAGLLCASLATRSEAQARLEAAARELTLDLSVLDERALMDRLADDAST